MKTTRYEDFKFLKGNRAVDRNHVENLMKSIAEHGYHGAPIVVAGDMTIIDGQHRFAACKGLGIPVPYIIDKDATLETTRYLNVTQRRWAGKTFATSFADEGNENYIRLQTFMKETGTQYRYALKALCPDLPGKEQIARDGKLIITDEQVKRATEIATFWNRFKSLCHGAGDAYNSFRNATLILMRHPKIDIALLAEKLEKYGLNPYRDMEGCIRELGITYNYKTLKGKKVDFSAVYADYLVTRKQGSKKKEAAK